MQKSLGLLLLFLGTLLFSQSPPDRVYWEYITSRFPQISDSKLPRTWIWGWSGGGGFAWFQKEDAGIQLRILDLVEDEQIFTRSFDYDSIQELWESERQDLLALQQRFDLTPTDFQPALAPFADGDHYYTIDFDFDRDPSGLLISSYRVILRATGLGEKILTRYDEDSLVWAYPIAYLPSPLESRIAVFVLEFPWEFGGTGGPRFRIIGGHLRVGFDPQE